MQNLQGYYPVIATRKVETSRDFYQRHFGFTVVFDAGWYVSMKMEANPTFELALLDCDHPTVPADYRQPVQGLLINFEVPDVDAVYNDLVVQRGLPAVLDLKSEDFGQRHFITVDPSGVLIDVITPIPPSAEFAAQYME
ncbi:glyoxalase/bleomycin resistance/extradiol dioxygenase family protein [Natronospirillum operosum]|uniref:Glyoxalase/bleomycin resistance/extradiol dioxygenase family protein n=1 Tax=Natronospirillum operosum TaxID=2759953 RepID=A0A4Z0WB23_9GAMM|nr:VOC family protein [Natronospirillum operosum]TGG94934.1 glyoxalase/bleomycin resistance/extradiol dioxygenase family protein [Natronospirillum operosum]